jgi:WD40 repeat protein
MRTDETASDRRREVEEVLAEYLEAAQAGRGPDRCALLARHPELADELQDFFADDDLVRDLAEPLRLDAAAVRTPSPSPGDTVDLPPPGPGRRFGDYELLEVVATSGMGVVYRARQVSLDRIVALKMVRPGGREPDDLERFLHTEARAVAALDHPHLVPIHDFGTCDGQPFFSMKLIDGGDLARRIRTEPRPSAREAARIITTIARAVHHAHQRGILHRDLKPSNILLDRDGQPHVADFGLAKRVQGDVAASHSGSITGTPSYMAPEQAAASPVLTTAADVYGLGAILYELLTGRPPFRAESPLDTILQVRTQEPPRPRSLNPKADRDLETICLMCLRKDPARRYGSAEALADDLERWLNHEPIRARRSGVAEQVWKWCRRYPAWAALIGVVAGSLVGQMVYQMTAEARLKEQRDAKEEQRKIAVAETERADRLREEADEARRKAQQQAQLVRAHLDLEKGANLLDRGETAGGLLWLVRGLETAPEDASDLRTALRRQLAAGAQQVHPVRAVYSHGSETHMNHKVAFSPDGKIMLTASPNRLWLRETATGKLIGAPQEFRQRGVVGVAFSPHGKTVLVNDGISLHRLDATTGKRVGEPLGMFQRTVDGEVGHVGYTPDGKYIFGGAGNERFFRFWDAQTGKQAGEVRTGSPFDAPPVFSPDGKHFLVYGSDMTVWDTGAWQYSADQVAVLKVNPGPIHVARWSPDGKAVLVAIGNRVEYWIPGLKRGPVGTVLNHKEGSAITSLTLSPDGRSVYTAGNDGKLGVWDEETGGNRYFGQPGRYAPDWMALSPDGRTILTQARGGPPCLFDADTLAPLGPPLPARNCATAFSPDGRSLLLGCEDGTARLHEVRPASKALRLTVNDRATMFGFTEGQSAFLVAYNGLVVHADGREQSPFKEELQRGAKVFGPEALAPGGRFLLFSWQPGDKIGTWYRVFDLKENVTVGDIPPEEPAIIYRPRSVSLSGDGRTLVGVVNTGAGEELRRWDVTTGKQLGEPIKARGSFRLYGQADGGKTVLVGETQSKSLWRWDLETGKRVGAALELRDRSLDAALAPDGKSVLIGSVASGVRLWDLETGKPRGEPLLLVTHGEAVWVYYAPDGRTLATQNSETGEIRLWDAATLKSLGPVIFANSKGTEPDRLRFAFSPDGKRFTTMIAGKLAVFDVPQTLEGDAERIRLWVEVNTGKELDAGGAIVDLKPDEWLKRWQRLQKLGGLP